MKAQKAKLSDLTPDNKNANIHTEFGMGLLENSIRELGFGRSGLLSKDNKIIAGNGMTEATAAIGVEDAIIIDSDGSKPVYVRRTDIDSNSPEFFKMALADNFVAKKNINFDVEVVEAIAVEVPEAQYWTAQILEEKKPNNRVDKDRADQVKVELFFASQQHAIFKKAMKAAKQRFPVDNASESDSQQSNYLIAVLQEWLKTLR